jgi:hypothetical protein
MFSVLFWMLALGMWAVIVKVLHLGLHTKSLIVAFFAMIFRIFFPLKNLSRKLIVLLLFLFLGVK